MIKLNDILSTLEIEGLEHVQERAVYAQIQSFSPSIYKWNQTHFAVYNTLSPEQWLTTI